MSAFLTLSGEERTWRGHRKIDAHDPKRTFSRRFFTIRIIKSAVRIVGEYPQLRWRLYRLIIFHINSMAGVAVRTQFRDERLEVDGAFRATGAKGEL
jgi:hypothetical protein